MKTKNLNYLTEGFRSLAIAAGLLIAGTAGLLYAGGAQAGVYDLMAGQHLKVGVVTVELDATEAKVTLEITDTDWCLTAVHIDVAVAANKDDELAASKSGNPAPGEFDFVDIAVPCLFEYTKTLPLYVPLEEQLCSDEDVYVAAHAVVTKVEDLGDLSSDQMKALVNPKLFGDEVCTNDDGEIVVFDGSPQSYLSTFVFDKYETLSGEYEGWCLDPYHPIYGNIYYSCNFLSADEASLEGIIPFNENIPYVMWILNQEFVGDPSDCDGEEYTSDDVQHAIWDYMLNEGPPFEFLIEGPNPEKPAGELECRPHEIRSLALLNGVDYKPKAGDLHGIVCDTIDPVTCKQTDIQDTMFTLRTDIDETAWGGTTPFNERRGWATYITETCPE